MTQNDTKTTEDQTADTQTSALGQSGQQTPAIYTAEQRAHLERVTPLGVRADVTLTNDDGTIYLQDTIHGTKPADASTSTPEEQQQPAQPSAQAPADLPELTAADLPSLTTHPPVNVAYEWPEVEVNGLPEKAHVMVIPAQTPDQTNTVLVNGRAIVFDGEMSVEGENGPAGSRVTAVTLPANWDYAEGESRHPDAVPVASSLGPVAFDFEVNRVARKSTLSLGGQPLVWPSRVTLDMPASGLTELTLQGAWVQGISKGQAVPRLVINAIGKGDRMLSSSTETEVLLDVIAQRIGQPGSDLVQGSCMVPTDAGDRLASFIMVLTAGPNPVPAPTGWDESENPYTSPPEDLPELAPSTQASVTSTAEELPAGSAEYYKHELERVVSVMSRGLQDGTPVSELLTWLASVASVNELSPLSLQDGEDND